MSEAGGELERRTENLPEPPPQNLPVPYRRGEIANVIDWPELATWARNRGAVIFGLILIAVQLIWKSIFIGNYFFWQDDFHFLELGLGHSFSWSYLTYVGAGHLFPGVYAIAWVVARIALYNWAFASAITVIMLAAADLAAFRLLRTLFGDRPAKRLAVAIDGQFFCGRDGLDPVGDGDEFAFGHLEDGSFQFLR